MPGQAAMIIITICHVGKPACQGGGYRQASHVQQTGKLKVSLLNGLVHTFGNVDTVWKCMSGIASLFASIRHSRSRGVVQEHVWI